jgi:hypothetical protein
MDELSWVGVWKEQVVGLYSLCSAWVYIGPCTLDTNNEKLTFNIYCQAY